jgi:hypothetical protein
MDGDILITLHVRDIPKEFKDIPILTTKQLEQTGGYEIKIVWPPTVDFPKHLTYFITSAICCERDITYDIAPRNSIRTQVTLFKNCAAMDRVAARMVRGNTLFVSHPSAVLRLNDIGHKTITFAKYLKISPVELGLYKKIILYDSSGLLHVTPKRAIFSAVFTTDIFTNFEYYSTSILNLDLKVAGDFDAVATPNVVFENIGNVSSSKPSLFPFRATPRYKDPESDGESKKNSIVRYIEKLDKVLELTAGGHKKKRKRTTCYSIKKESMLKKADHDKMKECGICGTTSVTYVETPCSHVFCEDCMDGSLRISGNKCPLCRADVHRYECQLMGSENMDIISETMNKHPNALAITKTAMLYGDKVTTPSTVFARMYCIEQPEVVCFINDDSVKLGIKRIFTLTNKCRRGTKIILPQEIA